ncbi:hypothetical protein JTB14_010152 [Gonioctena quinquepunctata]|nr:hypothetical protein JTB14_010152 [Gonioctena quinquepunctata]
MFAKKSSICHKPDPGLFPYLAKELAANGINKLHPRSTTEEDTLDAVDAAAVMLSLKNGLSHRECRQVITTSPSQDHTYSSADSVIFFKNHNGITDCTDFRDPKESTCRKLNFEDDEERKIKEGAETLLNLAGVTLKRIHADPNDSTEKFAKKNKFQKFDMNKNETQVISARPRQLRTKKRKTVNKLVTDTNDRYIMDFRQENLNQEDR